MVRCKQTEVTILRVHECPPDGAAAWDAFVAEHPDSSFFHRHGWQRILGEVLGHTAHYLVVEQDGAVGGVLPLVHVKSLLFGNTLASLPFCAHAGPLARNGECRDAKHDRNHTSRSTPRGGEAELGSRSPSRGNGSITPGARRRG